MTYEEMIRCAEEENFSAAAVIDTALIPFDPMFRPFCEENLCGQYAVNYTCPPVCGTPEDMKNKILSRNKAIVLQTIWQIEDYSDQKAIKEAKKAHNAATQRLLTRFRQEGISGFPVGASGCALCSPCAMVEGKPCRFPELCFSCMSAYCVFVSKTVEKAGLEYDCGEGLLAFFGMYVFD